LKSAQASGVPPGVSDEHRQNAFRPTDGIPAREDLQPDCCPARWRQPGADAQLRRAIPGHGVCPTDLSGKACGISRPACRCRRRSCTTWVSESLCAARFRLPCNTETIVNPIVRGGHFWTPITPQTGSFFHAESHRADAAGRPMPVKYQETGLYHQLSSNLD
jgi:hypothetical protein